MTDKVSLEYRARVYNDSHGYFAEVREDQDSLGLCEIIYSDGDKDAVERGFCISWEMAKRLADAIIEIAKLRENYDD